MQGLLHDGMRPMIKAKAARKAFSWGSGASSEILGVGGLGVLNAFRPSCANALRIYSPVLG